MSLLVCLGKVLSYLPQSSEDTSPAPEINPQYFSFLQLTIFLKLKVEGRSTPKKIFFIVLCHFSLFSPNGVDEADAILEADSIKLTPVKVIIVLGIAT